MTASAEQDKTHSLTVRHAAHIQRALRAAGIRVRTNDDGKGWTGTGTIGRFGKRAVWGLLCYRVRLGKPVFGKRYTNRWQMFVQVGMNWRCESQRMRDSRKPSVRAVYDWIGDRLDEIAAAPTPSSEPPK